VVPAPWALHLDNPTYVSARELWNWNLTSASSGNIDGAVQSRPLQPCPGLRQVC